MLLNFTARIPEPLAYARACCYHPFATASRESHEQWILSDIQELLPFEPAFDPDNWPSEPAPWIKRDNHDPKVQTAVVIKDFVKVALERPDVSMSETEIYEAIAETYPPLGIFSHVPCVLLESIQATTQSGSCGCRT
jgi:hypothetical protein